MTVITPLARSYVKSATLPAALPPQARALTGQLPIQLEPSEAKSLVDGPGLIVSVARVPIQPRDDLVNCSLFGQPAASGAVVDWYDAYFNALAALGRAQCDTHFESYASRPGTPKRTRPPSRSLRLSWARRLPRSWS